MTIARIRLILLAALLLALVVPLGATMPMAYASEGAKLGVQVKQIRGEFLVNCQAETELYPTVVFVLDVFVSVQEITWDKGGVAVHQDESDPVMGPDAQHIFEVPITDPGHYLFVVSVLDPAGTVIARTAIGSVSNQGQVIGSLVELGVVSNGDLFTVTCNAKVKRINKVNFVIHVWKSDQMSNPETPGMTEIYYAKSYEASSDYVFYVRSAGDGYYLFIVSIYDPDSGSLIASAWYDPRPGVPQ